MPSYLEESPLNFWLNYSFCDCYFYACKKHNCSCIKTCNLWSFYKNFTKSYADDFYCVQFRYEMATIYCYLVLINSCSNLDSENGDCI